MKRLGRITLFFAFYFLSISVRAAAIDINALYFTEAITASYTTTQMELRCNYSSTSYNESHQNNAVDDVSHKKDLIYPSVAITFEM